MIDENTARRFIACGWIVATVLGFLTAVGALLGAFGLNPYNLIDAAIFFGLAFGVYRSSRVCAIALLLYHILNQALRLSVTHGIEPAGAAIAILIASAYILAIIGTFAAHSAPSKNTAAP